MINYFKNKKNQMIEYYFEFENNTLGPFFKFVNIYGVYCILFMIGFFWGIMFRFYFDGFYKGLYPIWIVKSNVYNLTLKEIFFNGILFISILFSSMSYITYLVNKHSLIVKLNWFNLCN
tara:strand:+ start:715 stop:1071 length:357 start_codon:yes stop_codon:yes gene_type:complete